ncbi:MAG: hypothetical protein HOE90_13325 [Bacteriovoracaceae bacterium]|jgi:uncharacterized protein|nr:hypothetical protein [Bacteriovoracaceae bacterium]
MLTKAHTFLDKIFHTLKSNSINIENLEIDHICYRTSSAENYLQIKSVFAELGECLIESEVGGRPIATYKLNEPISYKGRNIALVEVPAPKNGKVTPEGYEHIEVVIDTSFEEIMKKYPHSNFDQKGLSKKINPELVIKFSDCAIKFHHQSLEKVIEMEKKALV